jgi:hypothetical protein
MYNKKKIFSVTFLGGFGHQGTQYKFPDQRKICGSLLPTTFRKILRKTTPHLDL